jgi:hypothetical protein
VYARLAPGILKQLEEKNPADERGYRKARHHQWLTDDVGNPALAQHLHTVITLMKLSDSWAKFYGMLNQAFPKRGDTLGLPFMANLFLSTLALALRCKRFPDGMFDNGAS